MFRHNLATQDGWVAHGRSLLNSAFAMPLGIGVDLWFGHKQSVRPCQGGIFLNLDLAAGAFVKAQTVISLLVDILENHGEHQMSRVRLPFGSRQFKDVNKVGWCKLKAVLNAPGFSA